MVGGEPHILPYNRCKTVTVGVDRRDRPAARGIAGGAALPTASQTLIRSVGAPRQGTPGGDCGRRGVTELQRYSVAVGLCIRYGRTPGVRGAGAPLARPYEYNV